jgi:hypothetical protein
VVLVESRYIEHWQEGGVRAAWLRKVGKGLVQRESRVATQDGTEGYRDCIQSGKVVYIYMTQNNEKDIETLYRRARGVLCRTRVVTREKGVA